MSDGRSLLALEREIVGCERCPRLVAWCREVAATRVRRFAEATYWGRPVPGFGDPRARILIVGLAPAAHGGNRTGRVFTGDRSGDFLFAALHRAGLANQATSTARDDGLRLRGVRIAALVRCAPPANRPTPTEIAACRGYLERERALLPELRVVVALGGIAWRGAIEILRVNAANAADAADAAAGRIPRFGHGAEAEVGGLLLVASYHPSQQNTFTGRLTPAMLDRVLARARQVAGL